MMLINSNTNVNSSLHLPASTISTSNCSSILKSSHQIINGVTTTAANAGFNSNARMEDCNNNSISMAAQLQHQHHNQNFHSIIGISNGSANRDLDKHQMVFDSNTNALGGVQLSYSSPSPTINPASSMTNSYNTQRPRCTACHLYIDDKYIYNLMNTYWHEECLACSQCGCLLSHSCFLKNGQLFCKEDYFKNFGTRCFACTDLINSNELVMRIDSHQSNMGMIYYHLNCFKCLSCERPMQKGDEFVLRSEGIYCKHDFDQQKYVVLHHPHSNHYQGMSSHPRKPHSIGSSSSPTSSMSSSGSVGGGNGLLVAMSKMATTDDLSSAQPNKVQPVTTRKSGSRRITKRPRTILNAVQRDNFREAFKQSQKPCRKVRENLAEKTGLSVRVVQVWFQNERAKMKKMQRRMQQQAGHLNRSSTMDVVSTSRNGGHWRPKKPNGRKMNPNDEEETTTTTTTTNEDDDEDDEDMSDSSEDESELDRSEIDEEDDDEMNTGASVDEDTDGEDPERSLRLKRTVNNNNNNLAFPFSQSDPMNPASNFHNPIQQLHSMQNKYF